MFKASINDTFNGWQIDSLASGQKGSPHRASSTRSVAPVGHSTAILAVGVKPPWGGQVWNENDYGDHDIIATHLVRPRPGSGTGKVVSSATTSVTTAPYSGSLQATAAGPADPMSKRARRSRRWTAITSRRGKHMVQHLGRMQRSDTTRSGYATSITTWTRGSQRSGVSAPAEHSLAAAALLAGAQAAHHRARTQVCQAAIIVLRELRRRDTATITPCPAAPHHLPRTTAAQAP
jgi:hypothetical protein